MPFSFYRTKRLRFIFLIYWLMLTYIIAALVWWFIALNRQNQQMTAFKVARLSNSDPLYGSRLVEIKNMEKRRTAQYIGEGSIFLLLILSGALFIFRAVRRQFRMGQQQQNFMMAVTHELKTPVAITKLNLETLQKRKLDDSQQRRLIQNTIQEANRLNALCNNLLLASQMEAGDYSLTKEDISLTELVEECVNDFIIRYPQRLFYKALDAGIFFSGDRLMLQMGINNLIDNAIKYSPKESVVAIVLRQDKNTISVQIKDEGRGIGSEEKKKIFQKFYRVGNKATKEARGTGLGLYLTKKIAGQHHADIFVTDNEPTGSNFIIVFKKQHVKDNE